MPYHERNLPHWDPEDAAIFLTWRLHGMCAHFRFDRNAIDAGRAFLAFDRAMHKAIDGPKWLSEPAVARWVVDSLHFGERHLSLYMLIACCVMPYHVHVVVEPHAPLPKITKSLKGFTARKSNLILGCTGQPFWQDESYDRWTRNEE